MVQLIYCSRHASNSLGALTLSVAFSGTRPRWVDLSVRLCSASYLFPHHCFSSSPPAFDPLPPPVSPRYDIDPGETGRIVAPPEDDSGAYKEEELYVRRHDVEEEYGARDRPMEDAISVPPPAHAYLAAQELELEPDV